MPDQLLTSAQALIRLQRGNARFVAGWPDHPDQSARRRREVAAGQQPYVAILACADSRVPPEIIFDEGLGDLFVVRVAGNVLDDIVVGSLEYAVEHLHVPLLVVVGHDRCGAATAALSGEAEAHGHIIALHRAFRPAIEMVITPGDDLVSQIIDANVRLVVNQLRASEPILRRRLDAGQLQVVGARYRLESGEVQFFD